MAVGLQRMAAWGHYDHGDCNEESHFLWCLCRLRRVGLPRRKF